MNPRTTLRRTSLIRTNNPPYHAFITKLGLSNFGIGQDQKISVGLIVEQFKTFASKWVAPASDRKTCKTVSYWTPFRMLPTNTLNSQCALRKHVIKIENKR